jgi:ABC-type sugar transport system ATPase subunit
MRFEMTGASAEIRSSFSGKRGEIVTLAKKYAVGKSTMNRIVHGVSYSPVGLSALEGRK